MTVQPMNMEPISEIDLDDHWFTLILRVWRDVGAAVKSTGVQQAKLARRINMDSGRFSKVITGKASNVTLRTLHTIARATNHRLNVTLEPLADLPKQNYGYEDRLRERQLRDFSKLLDTVQPQQDKWTREGKTNLVLQEATGW